VACRALQAQGDYQLLLNVALSNRQEKANLYVTQTPARSSLLRPNRDLIQKFYDPREFQIVDTQSVCVETLDHVLAEHHLAADFLKVDVQGTGFEVLQGAGHALTQSVLGVEVEVEFAPRYESQTLFPGVHQFLHERGFSLFGLTPRHFRCRSGARYGTTNGRLVYANALYFRELTGSEEKGRILKALMLYQLYGYVDYAAGLFELAKSSFTEVEVSEFSANLQASIPLYRRLPSFPGRHRLAAALVAVRKSFKKPGFGPE